jgi:hypothetical protein
MSDIMNFPFSGLKDMLCVSVRHSYEICTQAHETKMEAIPSLTVSLLKMAETCNSPVVSEGAQDWHL